MNSDVGLDEYAARRDSFFARLVEGLAADERIEAAWLAGAHGRDEDDEWSDLDLHVAVSDAALPPLLSAPGEVFALGGSPLLVQAGFPSDSMPSGKFWLVIYDGPFEVDWNIGRVSAAERPVASQLLFEETRIPLAPPSQTLSADELKCQAQGQVDFFWAMAPIAVKYAGRGWTSRAVMQVGLLSRAFVGLWRSAHGIAQADDRFHQNRTMERALDAELPRLDSRIDPAEVLRVVGQFCDRVQSLEPRLRTLGVKSDPKLPGEVERLCTIAGQWASKGGSSPSRGSRR